MSPVDGKPPDDPDEVSVLIRSLQSVDARLQELTAGEVDSVVDRAGKAFLLRPAQEELRHTEAAKLAAVLNALSAHVAMIDTLGTIVLVNDAWRNFAMSNGLTGSTQGIGLNYLQICDTAIGEDSEGAGAVSAGIRSVLRREAPHFTLEYPCHSPAGQKWFAVSVTPLIAQGMAGAVVMHIEVTELRRGQESVRRFAAAIDASADAIFLIDRTSMTYIHVNDAACRMANATRSALLENGPSVGLGMSNEMLAKGYDDVIARSPDVEPVEFSRPGRDGAPAWYEMRRHAQHSDQGWTIVTLVRDVTERKLARDRITYLNRVYAVLSGINTLIVRVREQGELFDEACRIAINAGGFRKAWIGLIDPTSKTVVPTASAGVDEKMLNGLRQLFASEAGSLQGGTLTARAIRERVPAVTNNIQDLGLRFTGQYAAAGITSAAVLPLIVADVVVGVLALYAEETGFFRTDEMVLLEELAADISFAVAHIDKQSRLDYLAFYDALTGLANRTLFLDRLAQFTRSAADGKHKLAVLMLDIERFRNVNDSLGRAAGDSLLQKLAEWLTTTSGTASVLARVGADHFAIIMPEIADDGDAIRFVEKGLDSLVSHSFQLKGVNVGVTARVGVAVFPGDGATPDELLRNAEAALNKSKASGDRYLFYNTRMMATTSDRLTLESQLRQALEKGEFVLHYQPKVNFASGLLTGAEALIRWADPRTGLVPPARFIPVLEETGMIYAVGRWAMRQAVDDHLRWRGEGRPGVRLAVNVSPLQLRDRGFIAKLRQVVSVAEHSAAGLELEITESLIMKDIDQTITVLREIQAMGVTIAIDDFGTGFSSLSYLTRLPVDAIKIDRSFVTSMTAGPEGVALVSTIISLAHSLKLRVVAEGVETEDQARLLRLLSCDEMQGYLFSKPLPAEEFAARYLALPPVASGVP